MVTVSIYIARMSHTPRVLKWNTRLSSLTLNQQSKIKTSKTAIEALVENASYITSLKEFLAEKDTIKALCYWLAEHSEQQNIRTKQDIYCAINVSISKIDHLINEQLNRIIHHPRLQEIEAAWRGLWFICSQIEDNRNVKIRLLDASWLDVCKDINRALEFDQSSLFQKIYNDEYGIAGGEPFGVLIGDYEISHRNADNNPYDELVALEGMAAIAAAAFSPFITGASAELFGLDNFSGLGMPLNLENIFKQKEYTRWNRLRDQPDSRFLGLTVPKILARQPYATEPGNYKGIFFNETVENQSGNNTGLWMNASYGFAAVLIREFINIGWFGHIRGVVRNQHGGGLLTSIPVDYYQSDNNTIWNKPVTNVIITDKLEREMSDLGFIPLCQCYDSPYAAFYNNQSLHKPQLQTNKEANENAKLSVMLQHILCGSRIAHYIKVIFRDKIGSFVSAGSVEEYIQNWLHKYTTGREDLEWDAQAHYPLREAFVKVKEHPAKPGQYLCVIHIKPHYQLDQMVSELELATELLKAG